MQSSVGEPGFERKASDLASASAYVCHHPNDTLWQQQQGGQPGGTRSGEHCSVRLLTSGACCGLGASAEEHFLPWLTAGLLVPRTSALLDRSSCAQDMKPPPHPWQQPGPWETAPLADGWGTGRLRSGIDEHLGCASGSTGLAEVLWCRNSDLENVYYSC